MAVGAVTVGVAAGVCCRNAATRELKRHPIVTVPMIVKLLETTPPTAAKAVALLESLTILKEVSGRKRERAFSYTGYLELLRGEAR
jgi:hypothetical protein